MGKHGRKLRKELHHLEEVICVKESSAFAVTNWRLQSTKFSNYQPVVGGYAHGFLKEF